MTKRETSGGFSSAGLLAEEAELILPKLDIADAVALGEIAVRLARKKNLPVAIEVRIDEWKVFHVSLPGAKPENDWWIDRKARVVASDGHSSMYERVAAEEEGVEDYKKRKKMEEELQLALEAVDTLRQELQEVNLLNAKLLYVNKLFKAKNLTESQKIKVVQAFDKAESAKEAKLVYESLNETFTAKVEKAQIKESLGFASKAAGVAEKSQQIVESNQWIARMQKLANIK